MTLPLNEILPRLNPSLLARRSTQKQVELTDEVGSPFGALGQGITISTTPMKPPAPPPPPLRLPDPPTRMVAPVAPSTTISPPTPQTEFHTTPVIRIATTQNYSNGVSKPVPPAVPTAPIAAPVPPVPAEISASLAALSEDWPEGLRLEIAKLSLSNAQVVLPTSLIEPALKRGRVTLTWQNLRPLIKPTPPPASIHDGAVLELPLKVLAPLFLPRQPGASRPQRVVMPPDEIPNLFFSVPQPPAEAPVEPPKKSPEPIKFTEPAKTLATETPAKASAPEMSRPVLKPADAKVADSNYYHRSESNDEIRADETEYKRQQKPATDFTSRHATPQEIVTRAIALPGVAGAVVALQDGLKVASQIPPEFNADTLAAFLPQIFDRVSQCTRELRMGALNNFNFTVGNVPWRIFRVNAVYFAAFGHACEPLPAAQLAALAAELDRKRQ